jgi:hypothetical protein
MRMTFDLSQKSVEMSTLPEDYKKERSEISP